MSPAKLEIHFIAERVASASTDDIVLNLYRDTPTSQDMRRLADAQRAVHDRLGRSLGVLSLARGQLSLPDSEARDTAAVIRREMEGVVDAAATIIPGSGFWVASAISVINTISLVSRTKSPSKAFGNREQAIEWLLERVPGAATTSSVAAALAALESAAGNAGV